MRLVLLACAIVIAAACVRFIGLTTAGLWFDEIWHAEIATGRGSAHLRLPLDEVIGAAPDVTSLRNAPPIWEIPATVDWVLHPPLFHIVQRGWRTIAGDSDRSIRMLSAVLSTAAVAAAMWLTWRRVGAFAGILTGALLAVSATQISQAQDARGYPLLLLESIAAVAVAMKLVEAKRPTVWAILLALLFAAMMWTHYFAFGACAGLLAFVLWQGSNRTRLAATIAAAAIATIWLALWWPTLRDQLRVVDETADIFLKDTRENQPARALMGALATPARLLANPAFPLWTLAIEGMLLWVALVIFSRRHAYVMAWACALVATAVSLLALDLYRGTHHHEFIRYAFAASAVPAVVIGSVFSLLRGFARILVSVFAVGALGGFGLLIGIERNTLDVRFCMSFVSDVTEPDDALILVSPDARGFEGRTLYLYTAWYARPFPRTLLIVTRPIDQATSHRLPRSAVVVAANPETDVQRVWPGCRVVRSMGREKWGSAFRVLAPATAPS